MLRGLIDLPGMPRRCLPMRGTTCLPAAPGYRVVLATGMANAADARFVLCRSAAGEPPRCSRCSRSRREVLRQPHQHFYTCRYRPLCQPASMTARWRTPSGICARFCRDWPITRLDALSADWPHLAACIDAAREAGLSFDGSIISATGTSRCAGLSWQDYLAARPGHYARRSDANCGAANATSDCRFDLITGGDRLEAGIADFEAVYRRSWKEPEPFPDFNAALMREAASLGLLRLGVLHIGDDRRRSAALGRGDAIAPRC